jgi:hypothetical protein
MEDCTCEDYEDCVEYNKWEYCGFCNKKIARLSDGIDCDNGNIKLLEMYGGKKKGLIVARQNSVNFLHRQCLRTMQHRATKHLDYFIPLEHKNGTILLEWSIDSFFGCPLKSASL